MSQVSFGKQTLMINHKDSGTVQVLSVQTQPGVIPRLIVQLGFTLKEWATDQHNPVPIASYVLRGLTGELRLSQFGDAIAGLRWYDMSQAPRSSSNPFESHVSIAVDLDPWRLETVERWREGKPPTFWLQLLPAFVSTTNGWYDAVIQPFSFAVPQPTWLAALSVLQLKRFLILEVPHTIADEQIFADVARHLCRAVAQLDEGRYTEAIVTCRVAIESLLGVIKTGKNAIAAYLTPYCDAHRAAEYERIIVALKDLTNLATHASKGPPAFGRAEAIFTVQTAQHVVALIGELTTTKENRA